MKKKHTLTPTKLASTTIASLIACTVTAHAATVTFNPLQELAIDGSNLNTSGTQVAAVTANGAFGGTAVGIDFGQGGITTTATSFIGTRNTGLGTSYLVLPGNDANLAAALAGINFAAPQQTITISGLTENTTYRLQLTSYDSPNASAGATDAGLRSQTISSGGQTQAFTHFFNDLDMSGSVGLDSDPALGGAPNPFIGVTSALITANFTTDPGETSVDFVIDVAGTNDNTIFNFAAVHQVPEPSSTALLGLGGLALIMRRRK